MLSIIDDNYITFVFGRFLVDFLFFICLCFMVDFCFLPPKNEYNSFLDPTSIPLSPNTNPCSPYISCISTM